MLPPVLDPPPPPPGMFTVTAPVDAVAVTPDPVKLNEVTEEVICVPSSLTAIEEPLPDGPVGPVGPANPSSTRILIPTPDAGATPKTIFAADTV